MPVNNTLDESEIRSVVIGERYFRDSFQWDKLRNSYHPDSSQTLINISWYQGDIDGFVRGSQKMSSNGITNIHVLSPVEINIQGDKAFSVSVGSIKARFERDGHDYDLVSNCRFLSRLQKIENSDGSRWKMLTMEVIYVYDSIAPAFPHSASSTLVLKDMRASTRKSYKYLSWLLAEQGHEVNNNLPGVDNEQSVRDVLDSSYKWLYVKDAKFRDQ